MYNSTNGQSVVETCCVEEPTFTVTEAHHDALLSFSSTEGRFVGAPLRAKVTVMDTATGEKRIFFDESEDSNCPYELEFCDFYLGGTRMGWPRC